MTTASSVGLRSRLGISRQWLTSEKVLSIQDIAGTVLTFGAELAFACIHARQHVSTPYGVCLMPTSSAPRPA